MSNIQVRSTGSDEGATQVVPTVNGTGWAGDALSASAEGVDGLAGENAAVAGDDSHDDGAEASGTRSTWNRDLPFMLVVLAAIVVLFLSFALLIAFSPTGAAISALAIIAAPIATMVAAYYGISLALRQIREARAAAEAADERARAAEASARESDAWAAQMESGLRVAVAKLRSVKVDTTDVERAAGTPDAFF